MPRVLTRQDSLPRPHAGSSSVYIHNCNVMWNYLEGVLCWFFFNCYCLAAHLLMSYGILVTCLPQFVQHYPHSTEKSFDLQTRREQANPRNPLCQSPFQSTLLSQPLPAKFCKTRNTAVGDKLLCPCHKGGTLYVRAQHCDTFLFGSQPDTNPAATTAGWTTSYFSGTFSLRQ